MDNPSIEVIEGRLFAGAVADEIVASLNDALADRGRATLVLSGGSTPAEIYRNLARPPRVDDVDWSRVHLYWGDERWVPKEDQHSNYKMVHETLLSQLSGAAPHVCSVDTTRPTVEDSAAAYAQEIASRETLDARGIPIFDVMLLGMGEDGHTASIFPGSSLITKSGGVAAAAVNPHDSSPRVTLTADTIFSARKIFIIVKGESKADVVRRVIEEPASEQEYPITLFRKATGAVTWFMDSGAASKLAAHH